MKIVIYISFIFLAALLCYGCDRAPAPAPAATAVPVVEFRIAVKPDDLSEVDLNRMLLALSDEDSPITERYEWIRSCGKHSWSNQEIDAANLDHDDGPLLYTALLVEDWIVARMNGIEYILVHARLNTAGNDIRDDSSHLPQSHIKVSVSWAQIETSHQGAMVPGLILTTESAEEMSRFARDHLLAQMVVVIDDCAFGFTQFSGFVSPQFFQKRGFYIYGNFERQDVYDLIVALRGS